MNRGRGSVEHRPHAIRAEPLRVVQMGVRCAEDLVVSLDRADLLASAVLVILLHRERVVQVDVLRLPVSFVLDRNNASVWGILGVRVVCLDHLTRSRRQHVLIGADVGCAIEPEQVETVLIWVVTVIGGRTPRLTALEWQLEWWSCNRLPGCGLGSAHELRLWDGGSSHHRGDTLVRRASSLGRWPVSSSGRYARSTQQACPLSVGSWS